MAYTKQTWLNGAGGGTPRSAARFNYMEDGIQDASDRLAVAEGAVADAATTAGNAQTDSALARAAASAPYLAVDTFTRPDSAALGATETGQAWTVQAGGFAITSGRATSTTTSVAVFDAGTPDVDVTCLIAPQTGSAPGVAFRAGPTVADRLSLHLDTTNGLRLNKTDTSVVTPLVTTAQTFTVGVPYLLRVVALAGSVTGYLNGVKLLTYTLTTPEQTKYSAYTRVGLRNTGSGSLYENLLVARAETAATGTGNGLPAGSQAVFVATGDDSDLTSALASVPAEATVVAVKVAGT